MSLIIALKSSICGELNWVFLFCFVSNLKSKLFNQIWLYSKPRWMFARIDVFLWIFAALALSAKLDLFSIKLHKKFKRKVKYWGEFMMIIVFTLTVCIYYSYRARNIAHRNQLVILSSKILFIVKNIRLSVVSGFILIKKNGLSIGFVSYLHHL